MQSFLIVGSNQQERLEKVKTLTQTDKWENNPDFLVLQSSEGSIGVEEVRSLAKKISLKPFSGNTKVCLIIEAQNLTLEAQNSFLKTLEEPPQDTTIILTAPAGQLLLPTLVSRCQIISLNKNSELILTEDEEKKMLDLLLKASGLNPGQKIKLIETLELAKDRQRTLEFLEKLTLATRKAMLGESLSDYFNASNCLKILRLLNQAKLYLSVNCNVKLVLEIFLLDLPDQNQ